MNPRRVVSLADRKNRTPPAEDIARLLRAVDEGRPVHPLRPHGHTMLRRYVTRLARLAGTITIPGDLAASFGYTVGTIPAGREPEAEKFRASLWRALHGRRMPEPGGPQKDTHKRVLSTGYYITADIFADIFCDSSARLDATPEVRELLARAFKELAALVGVPVPAFAWSPRAWKKAKAAYVETFRAVRLLCEAEGLKDIPHHADFFMRELGPYTHAGRLARVAAWLHFALWDFYCVDAGNGRLHDDDRLDQLAAALAWSARLERYGADAVRRAEECRARIEADALEAARAAVPDVDALLTETGTPDIDAALYSELGDDLRKFLGEKGGAK